MCLFCHSQSSQERKHRTILDLADSQCAKRISLLKMPKGDNDDATESDNPRGRKMSILKDRLRGAN